MGIKTHKPTTSTMRYQITSDFAELTTDRPHKPLLEPMRKTGGRNSHGHLTSRFMGGGHKQMYRRIDFYRHDKVGVSAKVLTVEYDPNRSARISLVQYEDGEKRYIIWPDGLAVGDTIVAGDEVEIKIGNAMPLRRIPPGQMIHNIELQKNRGAQIVRSAGSWALIQAKEGPLAHIKLPSGEIRLVDQECWATIGQVGNSDHKSFVIGKAGRSRWLGRKPHVRGIAMNPVDHPHGGGEGKSGQGNPHPVSPWGWHTKGRKTRKPKKYSNRFVVKRRK
ncbi:MAG: 50S ribosomal protein L2 [Candidatus Omnitrophica bacterium CG11_big_fil_rev_8_21_14_0_20_63_9]|nr:MAG: 50S ribosomal protein L2 [Candidatus Omnitrophica bacterium CG11_big_fil_rev_8_21_14_0_20_63_9]